MAEAAMPELIGVGDIETKGGHIQIRYDGRYQSGQPQTAGNNSPAESKPHGQGHRAMTENSGHSFNLSAIRIFSREAS
jgi:hypothetical protein